MWWKEARLYELYIDKFASDIKSLTTKLDYFTKLGINTLHILPHYPSPMVDDGYDISDYRGVRPELGTLDDFKTLLAEARKRNIRILTDFVLNHTSREHPWFLEARSSRTNPKRDWYLWSKVGSEFAESMNPFPDMKPNNWIYSSDTDDYYFATFYPGQPDLNWDNPEVFEAILSAMEFWAELGVSGFRLDAAPYLIKRDGTGCRGLPETHDVLKRLRARLEKKYPDVILLAEAAHPIEEVLPYFGNGDECHMAYNFPLMGEMWKALMDDSSDRLQKTIELSKNIPANCQWATFLRNHDEIELITLPEKDREPLRAWLDPHNQYPFRKGETTAMRIASIFRGDTEKILQAFKLLYAMPGVPVMYYGDELGMENVHNIAFILDTRRHVRGEFDWTLAEHQMVDPQSLWSKVATLIKDRSTHSPDAILAK